jgi:hypothetical protein
MIFKRSGKLFFLGWSWFSLLTAGCASVHPGEHAEVLFNNPKLNLDISGYVVADYSDANNAFIDFTFENKAGRWVRIDQVEFSYGEPDSVEYNVIVGRDLADWANAFAEKKKVVDQRKLATLEGLLLAGSALVLATGELRGNFASTAERVGQLALAGAAAYTFKLAADGKDAERSKAVPETHIYTPFTVPAQMFVHRWILINVPDGQFVRYAYLTVHTVEGYVEKLRVPLKFKT